MVLLEVGAPTHKEAFTGAFAFLCSDDYPETAVMDGFPKSKPAVIGGAEGQLAEALSLDFYVASSKDEYAGPFVVTAADSILSGDAAAEALAANPVYPYVAKESSVELLNESAKEVFFLTADGENALSVVLPDNMRYFIVNDNVARISAAIGEGLDPGDVYLQLQLRWFHVDRI